MNPPMKISENNSSIIEIKVLLIDDSEDEAFLLEDELCQGGIKAEIQRIDTEQGMIQALSKQHFDLLLVDYVMPTFSAPQAIERYHKMELHLPLIVISGNVGEDIAVEMMRIGAHDYISKHNRARLIPAIKRELDDYQQRQEKHKAENQLLELEKKNKLILETAGNGIFGLDLQGRHTFVNPAAAKMLGYEANELIGLEGHAIWHNHHPDGTEFPLEECPIHKTLLKNEVQQGEGYFIHKKGTFFPVLYSASPMIKNNQIIGAVVSFSDISAQKKAEAEQARLQRELQQTQKMEALGQLTGGIAHDFNNILGIILGYTEFALNFCSHKGETKLVKYLTHIEEAGERAKELVSQMLAFSHNKGFNEAVQLQRMMVENLEILRSKLSDRIKITTEIENNLPAVLIDPTQFNQLLMNLCVNAQDAIEGEGNIHIQLDWIKGLDTECAVCHKQLEGDWIGLSVSDTGSGIKSAELQRIFDPFYTTKDVGKGVGMGLAIIRSIMRNHQGHILLETKLGKGSTFRLLFPPVTHEKNHVQKAEVFQSTQTSIDGKRKKILILNNELSLGDFLAELLESYGYKAKVFTSSQKALELLHKRPHKFSLVIAEYNLFGITGIELVQALRKTCPNIPIILNVDFSKDIDPKLTEETGICYLENPVRVKSLIQAVEDLLMDGN